MTHGSIGLRACTDAGLCHVINQGLIARIKARPHGACKSLPSRCHLSVCSFSEVKMMIGCSSAYCAFTPCALPPLAGLLPSIMWMRCVAETWRCAEVSAARACKTWKEVKCSAGFHNAGSRNKSTLRLIGLVCVHKACEAGLLGETEQRRWGKMEKGGAGHHRQSGRQSKSTSRLMIGLWRKSVKHVKQSSEDSSAYRVELG